MPGRKAAKSAKLKGQGRKGRSSSKGPKGKKKKSSSSKPGSASALSPGKTEVEIDILSPAAMYNAYYICHHAPDCLDKRGFGWPGGKGTGKKGKKGKKKRKK